MKIFNQENLETMDKKTLNQSELFKNRLSRNYKNLKKWARKNRVTCYRIYDKDIPEVPLALDIYEFLPQEIEDKIQASKFILNFNSQVSANTPLGLELTKQSKQRTYAVLYLYQRPYEKDESEENKWLEVMKKTAASTLEIPEENVILKTRKKFDGRDDQYSKVESQYIVKGMVQEQGQLFTVNLSSYVDTGLFFDMRTLRKKIREISVNKNVLNLFCYTGSFSVYAAEGKAKKVTSVDLSNTYLEWAKSNMELNGFNDSEKYFYCRGDTLRFLDGKIKENKEKFDIIILDPPTFSNSKKKDILMDINKDWPLYVNKCLEILSPEGKLYFSTNSRRLQFDSQLIDSKFKVQTEEITEQTIPEDYRNNKIHRAFLITFN